MKRIDVVTAVITRVGVTVQVVGQDTTMVEYKANDRGVLECTRDDSFEETPEINQSDELLEALVQMTERAQEVFTALNAIK